MAFNIACKPVVHAFAVICYPYVHCGCIYMHTKLYIMHDNSLVTIMVYSTT